MLGAGSPAAMNWRCTATFTAMTARRPSNPRDWFMRRIYTHEGEFYSLSREAALTRLRAGIEMFQRYDWPLQGFVAPAWLMSEGTRQALRQLPLSYTSDRAAPVSPAGFRCDRCPRAGLECAQCLASWRVETAQRATRTTLANAPVIRLGLHPVDMRHEFSRTYWLQTLKRLLDEGRVPMTKARWLALHSQRMGRAA